MTAKEHLAECEALHGGATSKERELCARVAELELALAAETEGLLSRAEIAEARLAEVMQALMHASKALHYTLPRGEHVAIMNEVDTALTPKEDRHEPRDTQYDRDVRKGRREP